MTLQELKEHICDLGYEDSIDFIEFNTIRALPYYPDGPIVLYEDE